MNRQEFVDALRIKLLEAGFSDAYADGQCTALLNRLLELPDATADSYTTEKNLEIVVKKLIANDGHQRKAHETVPEVQNAAQSESSPEGVEPDSASADELPSHTEMPIISDSDVEIVEPSKPNRFGKLRPAAEPTADQYITCDHPKLLTALLGILCAPTILLLLVAFFGAFAALFILLAAAILLIAVGIIAIVGGGSVISLVSLLYGATQVLSSTKYIGLHEIGFGLLVAGVTMAASIILYNVAVRLIPFLFQKIAQLTKLFIKQLVNVTKNAVKGCEQL